MITKFIRSVKSATFAITFKDPAKMGMLTPIGTGFFVSPNGTFITAAHVIRDHSLSTPSPMDASSLILAKEPQTPMSDPGAAPGCHAGETLEFLPEVDFALLKFDFQANRHREWLAAQDGFPTVTVSRGPLEEGQEVFSFGYPLSASFITEDAQGEANVVFGHLTLSPRTTSAIVSSKFDLTRPVYTGADPVVYVLDKALNYGNSGGPIVSSSSGLVHAFCTRFQPVFIPQPYIKDKAGKEIPVMMPSLYGIVTSLSHPAIIGALSRHDVTVSDQ